jgi:hypothetical protein
MQAGGWRVQRIENLEALLKRYLDDHNRGAKTAGLGLKCDCDLCDETRARLKHEITDLKKFA